MFGWEEKNDEVKQKISGEYVEETDHRVAVGPVLTPGRLAPGLRVLTGMELWPFREEAGVLLLLVTTGEDLGEEGGEAEV